MNQDMNFIVFLSPLFFWGGNSGRATNGRNESAIIKGVRKKRREKKKRDDFKRCQIKYVLAFCV
jgi:hypothetical protein